MERLSLSFSFTIVAFSVLRATLVTAQSPSAPAPTPSAPAPAPSGPTNVTAILEKAGQYTILIRLLKSTGAADRINTQLNNSNQGLTLFAPTDSSFGSLKSGTLNGLNDEQKVGLMQFHILSSYVPLSQFQTVSNPLLTQAGGNNYGQFPLNVTTSGNLVNFTTGIDNASIAGTVYTDGQLAVYQMDNVLLPQNIFGPHPPAPAPSPSVSKKPSRSSAAPSSDDSTNASAKWLKVHQLESSFVLAAAMIVALFWL